MITRLVSLGSVIVDLVLEVPRLPDRGGDVLATQRGITAGGAFNVLSAACRLGLPSLYAGPHGTGPFGDLVRETLDREGIWIGRAPTPGLDTGWTLALVEPDGERTFVTVTGADASVDADALRPLVYLEGDAVYVSGYDLAYPDAGAAIADHVTALRGDLVVLLDPGPLVSEIPEGRLQKVLARADILSLNERELSAMGGVEKIGERMKPSACIVARAGARGAVIHQRGQDPQAIESAKVDVVDTSGAGDVHVGANLAGLARGLSWPEAVLLANRAAAYAVSRRGPAAGPTNEELRVFGAGR